MFYSKKIILSFLFLFLISLQSYAQSNDLVTLTTYGYGTNQDAATQSALRNAVEEAFGTFVSSKTEILNDELVTDEITSVSSGNIQDYKVLSKLKQEDGAYSVTVRATVSISKLIRFTENKGGEADLKGGMFARNIKLQQLNEESEYRTVKNVAEVLKDMADQSFDFSIKVDEPTQVEGEPNQFRIPLEVRAKLNSNFQNFKDYLFESLQGISMTQAEVDNYIKLNKDVYKVVIFKDRNPNAPALKTGKYANFVDKNGFHFFLDDQHIFGIDWDDEQDVLLYGYFGDQPKPNSLEEMYPLIKKDIKEFLAKHFIYEEFYFRNSRSDVLVKNLIHYLAHSMQNFEVDNGIQQFGIYDVIVSKKGNHFRLNRDSDGKKSYRVWASDWFRPGLVDDNFISAPSLMYGTTKNIGYSRTREDGYFTPIPYKYFSKKLSCCLSQNNNSENSSLAGSFAYIYDDGRLLDFRDLAIIDKNRRLNSDLKKFRKLLLQNYPFYMLLPAVSNYYDFGYMLNLMIRHYGGSWARYRSDFIDTDEYREQWQKYDSQIKSISIFSFISLSADDGTSAIFKIDDIRSLDELNRITGYEVNPIPVIK